MEGNNSLANTSGIGDVARAAMGSCVFSPHPETKVTLIIIIYYYIIIIIIMPRGLGEQF